MTDHELQRTISTLASELAKLQQTVRLLQRAGAQSQLGHSSIDDGYLTVLSGGTVRQIIGLQPDGTVTHVDVNGPAPPVPAGLTVTAAPAGLTVAWNGTFSGGAAQPADFTDVEIHVSTSSSFTPSISTLRGALTKAGQATVQPLTAGTTYYVGLLAVNTSGAKSALSGIVSGVPSAILFSPLTASQIGYLGVLNANPYFTGGDGTGWQGGGSPSGTVSVVTTQPSGSPYAYALKLVSNTTGGGDAWEPGPPSFPVVTGQQYLVTGLFYSPGTSVNLGLSFLNNGVWVNDVTNTLPITANTWTQLTTVITAPSSGVNGAGPVFRTAGQSSQYTMYGQAILAMPQVPGALIQAGTVTAAQIAAGTITAAQIAAGTVVAGIVNGTTVTTATLIVDTSGTGTGEFIYNGTAAFGNMIGSWAAAAGTDAYGNPYPAGLSATQGQLTGIGITNADIMQSILDACTINNPILNNSNTVGGSSLEEEIIFDSIGGNLLIYIKTTTTTTLTGDGTWTAPAGSTGTAKIECWGAGGGGGNDASAAGGGGGGGGEYACEPFYPITAGQSYSYSTGVGGNGTTNGPGGAGNDTWFDAGNVYAHGGQGGGTNPTGLWVGSPGGTGSTNTTHYNGGAGANGFGPNGGGGGGGSSAGSAAVGVRGTDGSSGGGGAGGSAPTGGGSGGAGGANTVAGSNGNAPGGGGGGSGTNGGSSSRTDSFLPTGTYSYYGADNTEGFPRTLANTNGNVQQGCPNDPNLGTFFSFAHYNSSAIVSALSGRTVDAVSLTIDCLHSWYNSGMTIYLDYSGVSSFPSPITIPSSTHVGSYGIGEGQTATISLPASVGTAFQSGAAQSLYFHAPNQGLSYYGYFQGGTGGGAPKLNIASHSGSSPVPSGNGANGKLQITYVSGVTLAASFSGTAFTDTYGNSIPAGVMVNNVQIIQPGSSPAVPETWHTPALGTGWAQGSHSSGTWQNVRYRKITNNEVEVNGLIHTTSASPASTIWTMPTGYIPTTLQRINTTTNATGGILSANGIDFHTDGTVVMEAPITSSGVDVQFNAIYPLD